MDDPANQDNKVQLLWNARTEIADGWREAKMLVPMTSCGVVTPFALSENLSPTASNYYQI